MSTRTQPSTFYCEPCRDWTPVTPASWSIDARCLICGEDFQCGECGSAIDHDGDCMHPDRHTA